MSRFDDMLAEHKLPTPDDLDISFPARREVKPSTTEHAELPAVGEHGGAAGGSSTATEAHVGAAVASSSPEPAPQPQRDEPDDGEHTDSTEEQLARREAAKDRARATDPAAAEEADAAQRLESAAPHEDVDVDDTPHPVRDEVPLEQIRGTDPVTFTKIGGASYGEGVELVGIKRFPQIGIDRLRIFLAETTGPEFATAISAPALITAFLVANLGIKLELDANTRAAAEVFRAGNARVSVVEDKVDHVLENIDVMAAALRVGLRRMAETAQAVDAVDMGVSYLITDRVAGLSTADVDETNVNVGQKKVLTARTRIHEQSLAQRKIEQERNERSTA